ncbi:Stage III sporulation protein AD, partial [Dysosmobacter welbionis]
VQLEFLALQLRHAGVVALGLLLLLLQHGALFLIVVQLPLNLHAAGDIRVFQIQVGTGLVDQVDGLVRQEPVGDVPLTEQHRLTQDPLRDLHPVVLLILGGQALENLHRVLNGGLVHRHRLEPPLQSGVLL